MHGSQSQQGPSTSGLAASVSGLACLLLLLLLLAGFADSLVDSLVDSRTGNKWSAGIQTPSIHTWPPTPCSLAHSLLFPPQLRHLSFLVFPCCPNTSCCKNTWLSFLFRPLRVFVVPLAITAAFPCFPFFFLADAMISSNPVHRLFTFFEILFFFSLAMLACSKILFDQLLLKPWF